MNENLKIKLFRSGKLKGCRKTIFGYIKKLQFALDMRSLDQYQKIAGEIRAFCDALSASGNFSKIEADILFDFIIESAKRNR